MAGPQDNPYIDNSSAAPEANPNLVQQTQPVRTSQPERLPVSTPVPQSDSAQSTQIITRGIATALSPLGRGRELGYTPPTDSSASLYDQTNPFLTNGRTWAQALAGVGRPPVMPPSDRPGTAPRTNDNTRVPPPGDRTPPPMASTDYQRPGTVSISYADATRKDASGVSDFDKKLATQGYDTLRIPDLPQNVILKTWVDERGYFFWFEGGNDGNAKHYLPAHVKKLEVNGSTRQADEMRIETSQAWMQHQNGIEKGFVSYTRATDPIEYMKRMSKLSWEALAFEEKMLREGAANSPDNPYFNLYLSDVLLAKAFKPVLDGMSGTGQKVPWNNPQTIAGIDAAMAEARKAQQLSQQYGRLRAPNTGLQQPLGPLARWTNPDLYWGGALYQGYQREVQLSLVKQAIQSGFMDKIELPPNLPPR